MYCKTPKTALECIFCAPQRQWIFKMGSPKPYKRYREAWNLFLWTQLFYLFFIKNIGKYITNAADHDYALICVVESRRLLCRWQPCTLDVCGCRTAIYSSNPVCLYCVSGTCNRPIGSCELLDCQYKMLPLERWSKLQNFVEWKRFGGFKCAQQLN